VQPSNSLLGAEGAKAEALQEAQARLVLREDPRLQRPDGSPLGALDQGGEELRAALASARKRRDAYETALLLDLVIAIDEATGVDVSGARAELASLRERLGIVTMPAVSLGSIRPAEARPAE